MKKCAKCGTEKDLTEFCKWAKGKDGLSHYCRSCKAAYNAMRMDRLFPDRKRKKMTKLEGGFKMCAKCGSLKPAGDFKETKSTKCGLSGRCRQCLDNRAGRKIGKTQKAVLKLLDTIYKRYEGFPSRAELDSYFQSEYNSARGKISETQYAVLKLAAGIYRRECRFPTHRELAAGFKTTKQHPQGRMSVLIRRLGVCENETGL